MPHNYEYLSLFSGGLDSISIPFLAKYSKKRGILHHTITHNIPHGRAIEIFKKYFEHTKKQTMITSTYKNKVKDPAYLKTRGLIFLTIMQHSNKYGVAHTMADVIKKTQKVSPIQKKDLYS